MLVSDLFEADDLDIPALAVGDTVLIGKFKNRKAEITGLTKDDHHQPVLKTTKGDTKLFKPRIAKLDEDESDRWVRVYRGDGAGGTSGLFFSDSRAVAQSYAGATGTAAEFEVNLSSALDWTTAVTQRFQDFVADCRQRRYMPPGAVKALKQFNAAFGANLTMASAIGDLLRERPEQVGHNELDPLLGFQREFVGGSVIVRNHEGGGHQHEGGGHQKDGTKEYIVFDRADVRPVSTQEFTRF